MLPVIQTRRNGQGWLPGIFNELFDDNFMGLAPAGRFDSPAVNVIENEKDFQIEVAAPGTNRDDFSVKVEKDGELTISLERKESGTKQERNYLRREFSLTSFKRSFIVPDDVDCDKISAAMSDGVLRVTLPKKENPEPELSSRTIEIG